MPPRLLLDGDDLRDLMLRVRDEMGPGARIVKAERIRTGGVGGFFAREHYELTVEVPDAPAAARRPQPARRPAAPEAARTAVGIDALLEAADAEERGDGATQTGGGDAPAVSTAGASFAQVLSSMQQIVGTVEPATAPAPQAPDGGAAAPGGEDVPPPADRDDAAPDGDAPAVEVVGRDNGPQDLLAPDEDRAGPTVTSLLELGIPARLLTGFTDPDLPVPISRMVRRIERAPAARLTPGNVVVLVGEPGAALRTALQMAHRAGLSQRDVVLAGDGDQVQGHGRRLQTVAAAARYRARVQPEALYVVVLGVDGEPERWPHAAQMLEALAPTQAWAVVDARRKAVELRRWLRVVGQRRPFDAVAASQTFEAQAPGVVLNLGIPVGWVDGLPASPLVWAAVLSERLADDARWE
ncbi:hypothetical protein GXB85_17145 [Cellulomonas sp. APG4]|uniref:hypothetical protein n=1 Tax=Cellulomonas sp. APG4 TaxID=1538656 RepID=UPI00137A0AA7|nr:hypothetical protein [Cellulomonas sp. APG4]NCT92663.1 hypothetical protein [Cellulomonas sp. APG4]